MRRNGREEIVKTLENITTDGNIRRLRTRPSADSALHRHTSETRMDAEEIDRRRHVLLHVVAQIEPAALGVWIKEADFGHLSAATSLSHPRHEPAIASSPGISRLKGLFLSLLSQVVRNFRSRPASVPLRRVNGRRSRNIRGLHGHGTVSQGMHAPRY